MKSRQQSSGKLNFQLPACLCLCAPPVTDHLGADLSFTAVITVKCRAIHHPLQSTPVRFTLDALDLMLHRHVLQGLLWPFSGPSLLSLLTSCSPMSLTRAQPIVGKERNKNAQLAFQIG